MGCQVEELDRYMIYETPNTDILDFTPSADAKSEDGRPWLMLYHDVHLAKYMFRNCSDRMMGYASDDDQVIWITRLKNWYLT